MAQARGETGETKLAFSIVLPNISLQSTKQTKHKLMSKPSAIKHKSDSSKDEKPTPDVVHSTQATTEVKQTAAQYIYDSMRDTKNKSIAMRPTLRKMSSIDKNSNRSLGLLSIDMLPEDLELHGDPTGGLLSLQADSKRSINSSDFVKDAFLSEPGLSSRDLQMISSRDLLPLSRSPVLDLATKLERCTTGDDIMGENIRLSSSEWVKDFEIDDAPVGPMPQSMFYDSSNTCIPAVATSSDMPVHIDTLALSPIQSSEEATLPVQPLPLPPLSPTISRGVTQASSDSKKTKTKKRRKRIIDESTSCEPTDNDVLFGRGGFTNNRPGNIHFRQEALRLRPWYERSTKEEKYEISNLLLESVKSIGGRFLEKGSDGLWHEVIGNGARRKASQALRERIKGPSGHLSSSLTTVKSLSGDEEHDMHGVKKVEV